MTNDVLYQVKTAKTTAKAQSLISGGFEFVCDLDGVKVFRKWLIRPLLEANQ